MHVVGCPRIDLVAEVISNGSAALDAEWLDREGVGGHIATDEPFLLVSQHPVTTEYGQAEDQITETLMALDELKMPTIMLWPNVDAGSEDISRGMRKFRERYKPDYIRFYKNFPMETYLRLMRSAPAWSATRARRFARARSSGRRPSTSAPGRTAASAART